MTASWCSAMLYFLCSSSTVYIRAGGSTQRKDPWNGGTPMFAWSVHANACSPLSVNCADAVPFQELCIFGQEEGSTNGCPPETGCLYRVEITLIDWASIFEIEAIIVDTEECVQAPPPPISHPIDVLVIGDSISCGYVGDEPSGVISRSRGYLDAFPSVTQRLLNASGATPAVSVTSISYPGITLANPPTEDGGAPRGMADRFLHMSPWDASPWSFNEHPSVAIISLGTNDMAQDIPASVFATALQDFLTHLIHLFSPSLQHICVIAPFPDFLDDKEENQNSDTSLLTFTDRIAMVLEQIGKTGREKRICTHAFSITEGMSEMLTIDGLHPTAQGHEVLGQNLAKKLRDILGYARQSVR